MTASFHTAMVCLKLSRRVTLLTFK
ncbi:hypothetical protein RSAG8_05070, partial [Rhizoctonia solani AG-8 WAC10335]